MGNNLIWPKNMGKLIRSPWPNSNASKALSHLRDLVKDVREFRNRLFHHEPAWKKFGVLTEQDALLHLQQKIAKIEELLKLVAPEKILLLEKSRILDNVRRACSVQEIRRFQHRTAVSKINSMTKLRAIAQQASAQNAMQKIVLYQRAKRKKAVFYLVPY